MRAEAQKWWLTATALSTENARLREELEQAKGQATTRYNESLVARSSEFILSQKLFNSQVKLTDVHRALGLRWDYPERYPKAVALDNEYPHAPLDTSKLSQQCYTRIRFSLGGEVYTAAEAAAVTTELADTTQQ